MSNTNDEQAKYGERPFMVDITDLLSGKVEQVSVPELHPEMGLIHHRIAIVRTYRIEGGPQDAREVDIARTPVTQNDGGSVNS